MNDRINNRYKATPLTHAKSAHRIPKMRDYDKGWCTPRSDPCDSDESTASSGSTDPATSGAPNLSRDLSLVAQFDDIIRLYKQRPNESVEKVFYYVVEQSIEMLGQWRVATDETRRLQVELDKKNHELSDLENKLSVARKLLDQEKRNTRKAEDERDVFVSQINYLI